MTVVSFYGIIHHDPDIVYGRSSTLRTINLETLLQRPHSNVKVCALTNVK